MESLERNAILTMKDRPRLWVRFVDDVLAIVKRTSLLSMLEHLNKQNAVITFTMEVEKDGKLPFLDGEIAKENVRLNLSVYQKPTHSGRYLNFTHHPIGAKCSTADALFNRAELIPTDATQKDAEFRKDTQEHLKIDHPSRFVGSRLDRAKKSEATSSKSDCLAQTAGKDHDRGDSLRRRCHTAASASAKTTQHSRRWEAGNLEMVPTTPPERQLEPR